LNQVRLVDILDRVRLFTGGGRKRVDTNGTSVEHLDNRAQYSSVPVVQAKLVDLKLV
jgi:hypothetical protein